MIEEKKLTGYPSIDKPWLKYYTEEEINVQLPECTLYEHIKKKNADNLDRVAINYYGNNISYNEFFNQTETIASALENIGVNENDIVTVCMINSPETICLMFALNKIGATANMVYGVSTPEELTKYILDTKSKIVFTLDMFQDKFKSICDSCNIEKIIVANLTESMSAFNRFGARVFKKSSPYLCRRKKCLFLGMTLLKNQMVIPKQHITLMQFLLLHIRAELPEDLKVLL